MKIVAFVFLMLALPAALLAQTPKAPPASGQTETIYDYGRRVRDNELSQRFLHSLLSPSFTLTGQFAKWKRPICMNVIGMAFGDANYVEQHIRGIAHRIGAPLDQNSRCVPNILIFVTSEPKAVLDTLEKKHRLLFVASPVSEMNVHYPVQAWYYNAIRDYNGNLTPDIPWQEVSSDPWSFAADNTRLKTGIQSEMSIATIIVNSAAIGDMTLESIADYLALMSLAQTPATGHCQPAPSIANLFLTSCEADFHTTSLSNADLAMLTSLYETPDQPERVQMTRLLNNMRRNLEAGDK